MTARAKTGVDDPAALAPSTAVSYLLALFDYLRLRQIDATELQRSLNVDLNDRDARVSELEAAELFNRAAVLAQGAVFLENISDPRQMQQIARESGARVGGKVVLIEFGASWCVWCTHFQAFIHDPAIAPIVNRNFVVLTLVVHEREDKKALEHPGADARMAAWGGASAGLPFYVFLDGTGRRVANSNAMADGTKVGADIIVTATGLELKLMDDMPQRPVGPPGNEPRQIGRQRAYRRRNRHVVVV